MKHLPIMVPIITTVVLTAVCIFLALWLTSLVPDNEWGGLIKAIIIMFTIGCALIAIAWSAYFTWVIRKSVEENK
jgi:hypothetical protein